MKKIDQREWEAAIQQDEDPTILDVRTVEEYTDGHIPGAQNINVQQPQQFMDEIKDLDKHKNYYLYCKSGNRSKQACLVMDFNGFKNLYDLAGGFEGWSGKTE